jgi:NTE family protein
VRERPDILVLGGGGRQGDAWMTGLLAALEDTHGFDLRECEYFVGTSAGSIVAAKILSGRRLQRPNRGPLAPTTAGADSPGQSPLQNWGVNSAMALAAPFARLGLRLGTLPGEIARSATLKLLPVSPGEALDFGGGFPPESIRFDGRLRVVAVERRSGKRVVFGSPGAPQATVEQALTASCSLPLVFPPAVIAGREYVDGAIWSTTNLDIAPATRDAQVLIVAPMTGLQGPFSAAVRAAARAALLLEASAMKTRGARTRIISPDRDAARSIGPNLMSDANLERTHAAGYAQGLVL